MERDQIYKMTMYLTGTQLNKILAWANHRKKPFLHMAYQDNMEFEYHNLGECPSLVFDSTTHPKQSKLGDVLDGLKRRTTYN